MKILNNFIGNNNLEIIIFSIIIFITTKLICKKINIYHILIIILLITYLKIISFLFIKINYIIFLNLIFTIYILSLNDILYRNIYLWQILYLLFSIIIYKTTQNISLNQTILSTLIGFLLFFIPYLITKKKAIGVGDIFVFTIISSIFKPYEVYVYLLFTTTISIIITILINIISKKKTKYIPLIPYMGISLLILIPFKENIIRFIGLKSFYLE